MLLDCLEIFVVDHSLLSELVTPKNFLNYDLNCSSYMHEIISSGSNLPIGVNTNSIEGMIDLRCIKVTRSFNTKLR